MTIKEMANIKMELGKTNLAKNCEVEMNDLEAFLLQKKLDKWKDEKIAKLQIENNMLKPKAIIWINVYL